MAPPLLKNVQNYNAERERIYAKSFRNRSWDDQLLYGGDGGG